MLRQNFLKRMSHVDPRYFHDFHVLALDEQKKVLRSPKVVVC